MLVGRPGGLNSATRNNVHDRSNRFMQIASSAGPDGAGATCLRTKEIVGPLVGKPGGGCLPHEMNLMESA